MAGESDTVTTRLERQNFHVERLAARAGSPGDAQDTVDVVRRHGADWIVLDGYRFGKDYHRRLKDAGLHVLTIRDDADRSTIHADMVLNHNAYADAQDYPHCAPNTRLLLGSRYALLRPEFKPWQAWQRPIPSIGSKVLVSLGGADAENFSCTVIDALAKASIPGLTALVVVGANNPHRTVLAAAAQRTGIPIELRYDVYDMPSLMAWADLGIGTGGTTTWERAFMGLPSLAIVLADNQQKIVDTCAASGLAVGLGRHTELNAERITSELETLSRSPELRCALSRRGREAVDGYGAERVCAALQGRDG
jgi:UDP-2,4-diacetamido-2,4,6-trideoxy-beta-L-altropyranose hydrolase